MEFDSYASFVQLDQQNAQELFRFGIINATSYADLEDTHSTSHRRGLDVLRRAIESWRVHGPLAFVAHTGNVLSTENLASQSQLASLAIYQDAVRRSDCTQWHVLPGSQDLRCLGADGVVMITPNAPTPATDRYYAFSPIKGWRVIILDAFDVSLIAHAAGSENHAAAASLLAQHNPTPADAADPLKGLVGTARRWSPFGGGLSNAQMAWLSAQLDAAKAANESVIILCHLNCLADSCAPEALLFNYGEVLALIDAHAGTVVAWICGSGVDGSYVCDSKGVHHIVPCAASNCGINEDAFGYVSVYSDRLKLNMSGRSPSLQGRWPEGELVISLGGKLITSDGSGTWEFGMMLIQMWLAVLGTLMTPINPLLRLVGALEEEEGKEEEREDDLV